VEVWGLSSKRSTVMAGLVLVAALAMTIIIAPAAASAALSSKGTIKEANGKALVQPWGLTFDSSGNLFVGEPEGTVVDLYNSSNAYVSQFGASDFSQTYKFARQATVNDTTGVVYVAESGLEELLVYKPLGGGTYELIQRVSLEGEGFLYAAVDNSSSAHSGDVYVTAQLGSVAHVYIFKTNGAGELGAKEELTPPKGGFSLINEEQGQGGLAVSASNGDLYLPETEHKAVTIYGPEGTLLKTITGSEVPGGSFFPIGIAVDESSGEFYVVDEAHKTLDRFSSAGTYTGQQLTGFTKPLAVAVQNAAGPSKGYVYVSDGNVIKIYGEEKAPSKYPLTVKKTGTGAGTVTSSPAGINCGGTCTAEYTEGETVELKETEEPGSTFAGWSGACTGLGACNVTMSAAKEVKAEFTLTPPANLTPPVISGTAQEGHTLKTSNGTWEGSPSSYTYQWEDCNAAGEACTNIGGANGNEYTLTSLDVGHTLRVVVTAKNAGGSSAPVESAQTPVVEAGASNEVNPVVEGKVPQTLSLAESTCNHVNLGEFIPGVAANYTNTCAVTATDTGSDGKLTAEDREPAGHEGHLMNGSYFLPKALEAKAADAQSLGGGGALTSLESPVVLLSFSAPFSADEVTATFNQPIAKTDGLRTGIYKKTITLTLSSTSP